MPEPDTNGAVYEAVGDLRQSSSQVGASLSPRGAGRDGSRSMIPIAVHLIHAGHQQDLRLLVSARKSGWHTPPGGPTNPSPAPSPASRPYFGDRKGGTGLAIKRSRILTHEFRSGGQQRPRYPRTRFAARSGRTLAAVRRRVPGVSQRQQDPRRQEPQVPDPAVPAQRGSVDGSRRVDDAREDERARSSTLRPPYPTSSALTPAEATGAETTAPTDAPAPARAGRQPPLPALSARQAARPGGRAGPHTRRSC